MAARVRSALVVALVVAGYVAVLNVVAVAAVWSPWLGLAVSPIVGAPILLGIKFGKAV